ncbi:MAG: hypothetical protein IJY57_00400 [Clostridia bacterium]|nr:hypothetical protein [Clostridia bacterium]
MYIRKNELKRLMVKALNLECDYEILRQINNQLGTLEKCCDYTHIERAYTLFKSYKISELYFYEWRRFYARCIRNFESYLYGKGWTETKEMALRYVCYILEECEDCDIETLYYDLSAIRKYFDIYEGKMERDFLLITEQPKFYSQTDEQKEKGVVDYLGVNLKDKTFCFLKDETEYCIDGYDELENEIYCSIVDGEILKAIIIGLKAQGYKETKQ